MEEPIVVGIDIGTTKVCTLVARLEGEADMRILGVGEYGRIACVCHEFARRGGYQRRSNHPRGC